MTRFGSSKVSVFQTSTGSAVDSVPVFNGPIGVSIGPAGDTVFVANNGPGARRVSTFSTTAPRVDVDVDVGLTSPVALVARRNQVWIATETGRVERYDRTNGVVDTVATIATAFSNLEGIATTANGRFVYVTSFDSATVMVIDTTNVAALPVKIAVGNHPDGIAITATGFAYVANALDGTVTVINTAGNTIVGSPITVGTNPHGVAVSPDGLFVFVSNSPSPPTAGASR